MGVNEVQISIIVANCAINSGDLTSSYTGDDVICKSYIVIKMNSFSAREIKLAETVEEVVSHCRSPCNAISCTCTVHNRVCW